MDVIDDTHTLPAIHALHLAAVVARWQVSAARLFAGLGLRPRLLTDPRERLSIATVRTLIDRAQRLTGEPGLGIYLGLSMQPSAHGLVGLAAMTAPTVREALHLAIRYAPTRTTAFELRLSVEGDTASLCIDERADFGDAREAVILWLMLSLARAGLMLTRHLLDGTAEFAFEAPEYLARLAHFVPYSMRFRQPTNRLVFDAAALDEPLSTADPVAHRRTREKCEHLLGALGDGVGVAGRARSRITCGAGGPEFRSLDAVVAKLRLSPRMPERQLASRSATRGDSSPMSDVSGR